MPEWFSENEIDDEQNSLDKRLNAYFGPVLPEQPLPASSWEHISLQLSPRRQSRRWLRPKWHFIRQQIREELPSNVQERLTNIVFQANMHHLSRSIRCTLKRVDIPFVSVSLLSKFAIRLTLPTQGGFSLSQAELDVLLASGLARYKFMRRATYLVPRLLLSTLLLLSLLATALTLLSWRTISTPVALLLLGSLCILGIACLWLLSSQVRQLARRADTLVVQWLGREQTCRGLHALAARSRVPVRKRWGELSLDERIRSICHTPVAVEDERFTLVR